MSETQKLMIAVFGFFAAGFLLVGLSKTEQSQEQKEAAAMIRARASMETMASQKCPTLIKKHSEARINTLIDRTDSDSSTYLTLIWTGDKDDNFKKISCTIQTSIGGVSKLVIDGKTYIDKE